MKPEEMIKIGERVEVEVNTKGEYYGTYLSKFMDIDQDNNILIGLPIEKGTVVPLRVGMNVNINATKKDGVYTFSGDILKRDVKPYPHFVMKYPLKINRMQRRNYVRVTLNIVVNFKILPNKKGADDIKEEEKAVSMNLSGGGLFFLTTKKIEMDTRLVLSFTLPNGILCKSIIGEVKRAEKIGEKEKERNGYGVEFIQIDDKIREAIIRYLFELQRERHSKGLII